LHPDYQEELLMKRFVAPLIVLVALAFLATSASAVELRFTTGKSANLFWMVDQLSQWDARYTSPAYRQYWEKKIELTDTDYAVLDQYARLRRRLARLDETEVKENTSPWTSLFGSSNILPHERFALAFFETATPKDAVQILKLEEKDQKVVMGTLIHFAKKIKDEWGSETAHLAGFSQKAQILVSLADAGGFIEQMKSFFGVAGPIPQSIPVNVLWGPPGFVLPAHMGYHIILPVSADKAESDEAVLQHLSMAIQEIGAFLLTKLPPETLAQASRALLRECGLPNPEQPALVRVALQVALGEVLFLRERFPDLPPQPLLVPWNSELSVPWLVDELARSYAVQLKEVFAQPGGFYPTFLARAIDAQKKLLPARPRFYASTGLVFGDAVSLSLFDGLFDNLERQSINIEDPRAFVEARGQKVEQAAFIVTTASNATNMYQALKKVTNWRQHTSSFRGLKQSSYVYPILERGKGPIFVVVGQDGDSVRRALLRLYTMEELPTQPVVIR
jgi:hypothetical protein